MCFAAGFSEQDSSVHDWALLIRINLVTAEPVEYLGWFGLRSHVCDCKTKSKWIIFYGEIEYVVHIDFYPEQKYSVDRFFSRYSITFLIENILLS